MVGERAGQRAFPMALGRVDDHAGRFVDDDDRIVFVEDIERDFCGAGPSRGTTICSTTTRFPAFNRSDGLHGPSSTRTWPASIARRTLARLMAGNRSARKTSSRWPDCSGATVWTCGQDTGSEIRGGGSE